MGLTVNGLKGRVFVSDRNAVAPRDGVAPKPALADLDAQFLMLLAATDLPSGEPQANKLVQRYVRAYFQEVAQAMAEDERQRIVKRANDGRAAARKRGVQMGRKPKLSDHQRLVARDRLAAGESARAIAKEWGIAHTTVSRVMRAREAHLTAPRKADSRAKRD